jgi:hypothetical protein
VIASGDLLMDAIQSGDINSIDKAAIISTAKSQKVQECAIGACVNGASLKELRRLISVGLQDEKQEKRDNLVVNKSRINENDMTIRMGTTKHPYVVREIIGSVLGNPKYQTYSTIFANTDWNDTKSVARSFKKMLDIIQKTYATEDVA